MASLEDITGKEKRLYQAEILVKERIGPEFILNYQSLI